MADEMWLREPIVGQTPGQMKLPFASWTRPAIKALIKARFGVRMQDRLAGKYLKRWGFTPQRPLKRALEQDPVPCWNRKISVNNVSCNGRRTYQSGSGK